ncbi:hypothetical protein CR513_36280, partial [Mucuna pruriens]
MEKEMVTMFIDTLRAPYYDKVVGNVASNFMYLMVVGERIELGIRRGKLTQASNNVSFSRKPVLEKKKGKTNASRHKKATKDAGLNSHKLVEIIPLKPLKPPYLRSYDPNAKCDYHGRAIGHATKRCWSLKHKVQDLLDGGLLGFQDQGPNRRGNKCNKPRKQGRVEGAKEEDATGCTTDSTHWMEEGTHSSQLREATTTSMAYIEGNGNPRPKTLIIHYNSASKPRVPFIIQVLAKPVYNNNIVSWRYPAGETTTPPAMKDNPVLEVTNIARIGGVTRSGRIFAPESLQNKDLVHAKKEKAPKTPKRIVMDGEGTKFLKLIHHSEYEMLDQLHKTPARVSLLSLLINSKGHRNLLLKVLK